MKNDALASIGGRKGNKVGGDYFACNDESMYESWSTWSFEFAFKVELGTLFVDEELQTHKHPFLLNFILP